MRMRRRVEWNLLFWHTILALKIHPTANIKQHQFFPKVCLLFITSAERNVAIMQSSDQWTLTGVKGQKRRALNAAQANSPLL